MFYQYKSPLHLLFQLIDFGTVIYGAAIFFQNICLLTTFLTIQTVIDVTVFKQLNCQLQRLHQKLLTVWQVHFERLVRKYFDDHTERVLFTLDANKRVFGLTVVAFQSTNILNYIYLPVYITFYPLTFFFRFSVFVFCFFQTAGSLVWVISMLQTNYHMVQSKGLLSILSHYNPKLTNDLRAIRLKWAMACQYELLTNKDRPLSLKASFFAT